MNRRPMLMGKVQPPSVAYVPRYLENTHAGSFKFWEVKVVFQQSGGLGAYAVVSRWGKIGTVGTTTTLGTYGTEFAANNAADTFASKKIKHGYLEKSTMGVGQRAQNPASKVLTDAEREKLAALLEDLDEVASS